jgi:hypothetical protein
MVLNMGPSLHERVRLLQANGDVFKNVKLHYKPAARRR